MGLSSIPVRPVDSVGEARLPFRDPWMEKIELRRDHRPSPSMDPMPESLGLGVPGGEGVDGKAGSLESSLLMFRRAMVEAATREAERVEIALQICMKISASEVVNEPEGNGCRLSRRLIVWDTKMPLLRLAGVMAGEHYDSA
jgi:hypothetical protein